MAIIALAKEGQFLRPTAMIALADQSIVVSDAATGELVRLDSLQLHARYSYPDQLREPVALASDGLSVHCLDRAGRQLVRLNQRLEIVETTLLPGVESRDWGVFLATTSFGERILWERRRSELVAIDLFGRESWRVPVESDGELQALAASGEAIALLFAPAQGPRRILRMMRFGAQQRWITLPDTVEAQTLCFAGDGNLLAISPQAIWFSKPEACVIAAAFDSPIISAMAARHGIAVLTQAGVRWMRWSF